MEVLLQKIREFTECPICSTTCVVPTMLPCSHTFCRRCLNYYTSGKKNGEPVSCPMCRASSEFNGSSGLRNLMTEKLVAIEKTLVEHPSYQSDPQAVTSVLTQFFDSAPKSLEKEKNGLSAVLSDMEELIKNRNSELKNLIDQQTGSLISELNRIREGQMAEFDMAVAQLGKSSSALLSSKESKPASKTKKKSKDNKKTPAQNGPLSEILSEPFKSSEIKFKVPEIDRQLLAGAINIIGKIDIKDDLKDDRPIHGNYLTNPALLGSVNLTQGPVVVGITMLDDTLFIVRSLTPVLQVYDVETFEFRYMLPVAGLSNPMDITSCVRQHCFYIIDTYDNSVFKAELSEAAEERPQAKVALKWSLGDDEPCGISVSYAGEDGAPVVVVTCLYSQKICEFGAQGLPLRCVYLQPDLAHPHHALRWGTAGTSRLILCHGYWSTDPLHRICLVRSTTGRVVGCFGDAPGDGFEALNQPSYMIVDGGGGGLLVADSGNGRVRLVDAAALEPVCDVLTSSTSEGGTVIRCPHRLCLDVKRGRLYVVENILNGKVLVFKVIDNGEE